ncbi:MAG: thiolase family protein [Dehalococcoidales bacterium]|nr:thiolase family protein [Dehalococcoidales bacterium]
MNDRDVLFLGGVRTAIGKFGGALKDLTAVELGAVAVKGALERTGAPPEAFDQGFVGHARQAGNGPNPGRLVALRGGLPASCPVCTIQQACVSGMQALLLAGQAIRLGEADLVMVAGTEHMSSIPFLSPDTRWGARMGDARLLDAMYKDGFIDPITGKHMGELTEEMAERRGITRVAQDEYALMSQQRAEEAKKTGFTARTVVPVEITQRKGSVLVQEDEHPRPDTSLEKLAALPAAFKPNGTVTAGNASGITDGAVALVLASRARARELGLSGVARLKAGAVAAVEPKDFALAPVPATQKALARAGLSLRDVGVVEINEAFAAMVLAVMSELDLTMDKVNLYGGAIAYGHPVGISGARIVLSLLEIMREKGLGLGLATICGNGGNGGAVVLQLET